MAKSRNIIGIDLGTSYSRVGVWLDEENRFELIPNDHGNPHTASYVAFTETERLIGDSAKNQVWRNPTNTFFGAKRLIGRRYTDSQVQTHLRWPFRVAQGLNDKPLIHVEYKGKEKVFSAEEVFAMVLGKMKDLAEVHLGSVVNGCTCVSIPHCFNFLQRQAIWNVCSMAGLETVALVSDHSCAAVAYLFSSISKGREFIDENIVLFFDLGGGTLEVTLVSIEDGIIEVEATCGDSHLGGEDFDLRLLGHFTEEIKLKYKKDVTGHPRAVMRLKKQVERVKLALTSGMDATIQIDSLLENFDFQSSISRSCFEEMNMGLFRKCVECVEMCLRDAKMPKEVVQEVVLLGGSSRIPKVQHLLVEFFNNEAILNKSINPDEAVVCGAVVQSGLYAGGQASILKDLLVLEVASKSYGLETAGGVMFVVIPRHTTIPTRKEQMFTTYSDDQTCMVLRVYEGERVRTRDNILIAKFELPGIPPASCGVPQILVVFDIDAHGLLNISARNEQSGQKWEIYGVNITGPQVQRDAEAKEYLRPPMVTAIQPYNSSAPPTSKNPNEPCSSSRAYESINTNESSSYEGIKSYSWNQVQDMTNGLTSTELGKGGFGHVYLGKFGNREKLVAVKVLDESSQQGIPEFLNEVNLLRRVNHENLVRLLGYCQDHKKVLIYEFAEEGTLWDHLHGERARLDWKQRLNIALQSACGLEYLHTGCNTTIFHRDIKSENILLTGRMVAKVADFGISKVGSDQDNIRRTHVTTMVKGTPGYLDPEYLQTGQLTDKSDVYSFGVLLLEIITGRKPIQNSEKIKSVIDWVNKQKGRAVADPFFAGNFNPKALRLVIKVAKQCTRASSADRPVIKEVVRLLERAQTIEANEKKSSWSWPSWT